LLLLFQSVQLSLLTINLSLLRLDLLLHSRILVLPITAPPRRPTAAPMPAPAPALPVALPIMAPKPAPPNVPIAAPFSLVDSGSEHPIKSSISKTADISPTGFLISNSL
jgi:hypothetical protein